MSPQGWNPPVKANNLIRNLIPNLNLLPEKSMKINHQIMTQSRSDHHWLDVLEEYHVKYIVLDPMHDQMFFEQLENHPGWFVEYGTEEAIIFVREEILINRRVQL